MRQAWAVGVTMWLAGSTVAGVYGPDEKILIPVRPDGTAEELSFGYDPPGRFNLALDRLADVADINPNRKDNKPRAETLARIAATKDPAITAADLLRTRQADAVVNRLSGLARGRNPDFRVLANLAHAHAVRGEWAEAVNWHEAALLDAEFPKVLPGTTPAQRDWLLKIEKTHYHRWLTLHRDTARTPPETEGVFPLFPADAKPADAIPIVQQLLLWQRDDTRLFWLLAELYAASGRLREAEIIFDQCASESRQFSNRTVMMANRATVKRAVAALPKPAPEEVVPPVEAKPPTLDDIVSREKLLWVGGASAAVVLLLIGFQVRRVWRRWR